MRCPLENVKALIDQRLGAVATTGPEPMRQAL